MEREKKRQFQRETEIYLLEQRSTRDKRLEEQTKQELLKEKQNKRECQHEMEISRLEQLGKKSKHKIKENVNMTWK